MPDKKELQEFALQETSLERDQKLMLIGVIKSLQLSEALKSDKATRDIG